MNIKIKAFPLITLQLSFKKLLLILILITVNISGQTDWVEWKAQESNYELERIPDRTYSIDRSNLGSTILSGIQNGYYFLISDLDGDNCPFYPSCSHFFVESVKETNFLQGTLMFADRFTRDLNFVKNKTRYSLHSSNRFYDPVNNYMLNTTKIKIGESKENDD
ncbi:MAG: membrane protein insertion efficiency factor YidD [Melioribacteraceae bacterium]|nr:membrane protein insertion efficiency factor YidD [Melioribacteraceae bacterium]MCF8356582.1 membrane protein insertion efficiency factor YidD [Melioribacteraceae bacterium]MCF8395979.1 membrane protein insertion efficiency factor YidD [Melioribacteraceae bacterium]MCF8421030.1 membrane protein insertion efficiency factor YidD [Melioribacteraceae bacterium]